MSKISLAPDANGTGIFTIASPNSNTNRTLTLPDDTGTIVTNSGNQAGSFTTLNTSGAVVFNDAGADVDFRVEGDTEANLLFVDAGNDRVGIGTSSPARPLDVRGALGMQVNEDGSGTKVISLRSDFAGAGPAVNVTTNDPLLLMTNNTERMRIDTSGNLLFNSGYGSVATAYGCRAWVNFDGTGTIAIRASGNVSSLTDNGVGYYSVNFTTAMPDANYSTVANSSDAFPNVGTGVALDTVTASAFRLVNINVTTQTYFDSAIVCASVFR